MPGERMNREALIPWLVLAAGLHALAMLGVRIDLSTARVRERPVLEVSLAPRGLVSPAVPRVDVPVPEPTAPEIPEASVSASHTDQPTAPASMVQPIGPDAGAPRVPSAESAGPAAVVGGPRREGEPDAAPTTPQRQAARTGRTPPGQRETQAESAVGSTADTAASGTPGETPARVNVATLERQASDWSAEYSQRVPVEPSLPPRNAYVEKVVSDRIAAAAYERDWQDKVERVGNMNYPEAARRKNLTGGLMLSVGVNADGTVHAIRVRRSSGHPELDEAAQRIVELAAPYAAFPEDLKKDYDVLWITRTWRFFVDNHLATSP